MGKIPVYVTSTYVIPIVVSLEDSASKRIDDLCGKDVYAYMYELSDYLKEEGTIIGKRLSIKLNKAVHDVNLPEKEYLTKIDDAIERANAYIENPKKYSRLENRLQNRCDNEEQDAHEKPVKPKKKRFPNKNYCRGLMEIYLEDALAGKISFKDYMNKLGDIRYSKGDSKVWKLSEKGLELWKNRYLKKKHAGGIKETKKEALERSWTPKHFARELKKFGLSDGIIRRWAEDYNNHVGGGHWTYPQSFLP